MCVINEGLCPPHYFMLSAPPEILDDRVAARSKVSPFPSECSISDRLAFFEKLQAGYNEYALHPSQTATIIDAAGSIEETGQTVVDLIVEQLVNQTTSVIAA